MNESILYSRLGEDPDLGELVEIFVQELPGRIDVLEYQARSRDWGNLARTAHQLKGAAGSYGFDAITPIAARLEATTKNGEREEDILAALEQLLSLCRRARSGAPPTTEQTSPKSQESA